MSAVTGQCRETGVDPINIAAHIYLALQEITARELPAKTPAIVTMGKFSAGHAPNIIPQEAVIEGTIRTFDRDVTALILRRIGEIADARPGPSAACERRRARRARRRSNDER